MSTGQETSFKPGGIHPLFFAPVANTSGQFVAAIGYSKLYIFNINGKQKKKKIEKNEKLKN